MAITRKHLEQSVKAAFLEGYEACWRARSSESGFDPDSGEAAWLASRAYRALTRGDGGN